MTMTSKIAAKQSQLPSGVYCPVVSLYKPTRHQEIDLDASYKYFSFLIRGGVHALVLAGSTAEAALLSHEERQHLLQVARKAALDLGLPNYTLVAGISGQSTNESITLAQEAKDAGADFGLLLPPNYWAKAVSKDVILDFYRDVADESPIPIVVYNVSSSSHNTILRQIDFRGSSFQALPAASISIRTYSPSLLSTRTSSE